MLRDYRYPLDRTVVIPNPVRLERFAALDAARATTGTVLVLGRIAARKGIEDVVAVARLLGERQSGARVRIVGGPGSWSDYTALLQYFETPSRWSAGVAWDPAAISAVQPVLLRVLMSAPASSSACMPTTSPAFAAAIKGV